MKRRISAFTRSLLVITLLGLAWRIAYVLLARRNVPLGGDQFFYTNGADLLAKGNGFIDPWHLSGFQIWPTASHPPLYELWLALASFVKPGSPTVHMLWSCVLGAGTIAVAGLAAKEVAGPRAGLVAAVIVAAYPNIWLHDGELLSETMAMFTTALVIWLAYRFARHPGPLAVALLGGACGLAALSRSELLLTLPIVLIPLVLAARAAPLRRRFAWATVGCVATLLVIAPWIGYNLSRFNKPVLFSTNLGATLAAANCNAVYYGPDMGFKNYECLHQATVAATTPGMDESELDAALRTYALHYAGDHQKRLPLVVLARWGRTLSVFHPSQDLNDQIDLFDCPAWVAWAGLITWYPLAGAALVGAVVLRRRRRPTLLPLLAIPVIVLISVGITFSQLRYRTPAEIAVAILAAVAIDDFARRADRPNRWHTGSVGEAAVEAHPTAVV